MLGADFMAGGKVGIRLLDRLPDGSRSLIGVSSDTSARWLIVDGDGRTVTDLRAAGLSFQPTTLSADGRLLAGFTGRWEGEAGWAQTWLRVADSDANFVLFGAPGDDSRGVWQALLDRGVLIRDVGVPGWLRVTAGTPEETDAVLNALEELL